MKIITVEDREKFVKHANHEGYLEGIEISKECEELQERYVRGEISIDEAVKILISSK